VVASCVLRRGDEARFSELTDSKLMTAAARDRVFGLVVDRAVDYSIVVISSEEIDALGIHVMNIEGMRRAIAGLTDRPGYVLTDGFRVSGLPAPSISVVKGDRAVACVAAASVLAKVTRDRIMTELHELHPDYGFNLHKGYNTAEHSAALAKYGPTEVHRWSYTNVAAAAIAHQRRPLHPVMLSAAALESRSAGVSNGVSGVVDTAVRQNEDSATMAGNSRGGALTS
jgi:ribonuclease HII